MWQHRTRTRNHQTSLTLPEEPCQLNLVGQNKKAVAMIPFLSKRWETIWFLAMGVCINYCIRVNVSIAAQEMKDDLNWTEEQKGELLYALLLSLIVFSRHLMVL
jgi:sugar phosphate permease